MPTYVYKCDLCGNQFEKIQSFKDDALKICPCGREGGVRRVIQPVGIVFKGSGWYINDSRKSESVTSETPAKTETTTKNEESKSESTSGDTPAKTETPAAPPAASDAPASTPSTTPSTSATPSTTT